MLKEKKINKYLREVKETGRLNINSDAYASPSKLEPGTFFRRMLLLHKIFCNDCLKEMPGPAEKSLQMCVLIIFRIFFPEFNCVVSFIIFATMFRELFSNSIISTTTISATTLLW